MTSTALIATSIAAAAAAVLAIIAALLFTMGPIGGPSRDQCMAAHPGAVCRLTWSVVP